MAHVECCPNCGAPTIPKVYTCEYCRSKLPVPYEFGWSDPRVNYSWIPYYLPKPKSFLERLFGL